MHTRLIAAATIFLSLTLSALADDKVVDKAHGFTITPSGGWVRVDIPGNMPYCALKLQKDTLTKLYIDVFEPDVAGETLDQYVQGSKNFILKDNGEIYSDTPMTVSGLPARKLLYSGKAKGYTDADNKYLRIIVQARSGKFLVVHGVLDRENHHLDEIENMVSTFEVGAPAP